MLILLILAMTTLYLKGRLSDKVKSELFLLFWCEWGASTVICSKITDNRLVKAMLL